VIVKHHVNTGNVEQLFRRLGGGFGTDDILRFENLAASLFAETQIAVHVITGSLKATGQLHTDTSPSRKSWSATISYGPTWSGMPTPVPGPWRADRPPSEYAEYEQRRPGHDWMAPIRHADQRWIHSMMAYVRGED
jgi:hypothetical protein